jgi:FMN phosphatase YigB (HAD superfamily)
MDLAPKLLHRFSSVEGYDSEPNLVSALKSLKNQHSSRRYDRIVIGVVTNSDDRVPSILSSFGFNVSPLRYGAQVNPSVLSREDYDIDFHCMSYDVGVEKPDKLIFSSAELMLLQIMATRDSKGPAEAKTNTETWRKIYVGDEYVKDVTGAMNAGWHPVLLDPNDLSDGISGLEDSHAQDIDGLFEESSVIKIHSIKELVLWLTGKVNN